MHDPSSALRLLGEYLRREHYSFVTVTPETHRRLHARAARASSAPLQARNLRDAFGWNRPFPRSLLPVELFRQLYEAALLVESDAGWRSQVRYSTLGELLCVHSAFPTDSADAVFFGPDTYRFCSLLARWAPPARRAVDLGCGTGAGGLSIAGRVEQLVLSDINPRALAYAAVNATLAGRSASFVQSDVLRSVAGECDLIVANPPYMRDDAARAYRDGGAEHGTELSVRIVRESLDRLRPGGTLIVYTGAPIIDGQDVFYRSIRPLLDGSRAQITYEQLDPDVFGEELELPTYAEVERIAAVGLRVCLSDRT